MSVFDSIRPPAFSFADRGTMNTPRGGEIVKIEGLNNEIKATVYKKPDTIKTWNGQPDGDPVYQVVVTVQSSERDPGNPLDEGLRTFWLEQTSRKRPSQWTAFVTALEAAGCAKNPQVGGKLWLAWVGEEAVPNATNPQKVWKAKYEAPTGAALNGQADHFDTAPAQTDPSAQPTDPRAALRSEIERQATEAGLRSVWAGAAVGLKDVEMTQLVTAKLAQVRAQAEQSIDPFATPAATDPFAAPAAKGPWD